MVEVESNATTRQTLPDAEASSPWPFASIPTLAPGQYRRAAGINAIVHSSRASMRGSRLELAGREVLGPTTGEGAWQPRGERPGRLAALPLPLLSIANACRDALLLPADVPAAGCFSFLCGGPAGRGLVGDVGSVSGGSAARAAGGGFCDGRASSVDGMVCSWGSEGDER